MDVPVPNDVFLFEDFRLDRRAGGLFWHDVTAGSTPVAIGSRALDVLSFLVVRHGELVSKDEIMRAVWPGTTVEEHNLTVQISALRRVLDEGRSGESCIQTVSGRGYRFVSTVTQAEKRQADLQARPIAVAMAVPNAPARSRRPGWLALGMGGIGIATLLIVMAWHGSWFADHAALPRLSIVVLPFQNLSGDAKDDFLANGITDDLTTDLSRIPEAFVIARETAYTYKGKATDVRQIGRELGVRYVLEGSVRRINSIVRGNVQLISAETGAHLWADRFDEQIADLATGQEGIVVRMRSALGVSLVEIEAARALRERPANPDASDLILRARATESLPQTKESAAKVLELYDQALQRDPDAVLALTGGANASLRAFFLDAVPYRDAMNRAVRYLDRAQAVEPNGESVLITQSQVLDFQLDGLDYRRALAGLKAVAQKLVDIYPNNPTGYFRLGVAARQEGKYDEAARYFATTIRLNPRSPQIRNLYWNMAYCNVWGGRDQEGLEWADRAMGAAGDLPAWRLRELLYLRVAAYVRTGDIETAKRVATELQDRYPFATWRRVTPDNPDSNWTRKQAQSFVDALRVVGIRDHVDPDADFGVPPDDVLHQPIDGKTPTTAPGVTTLSTAQLAGMLQDRKPLVIDTMTFSWYRSIPGAVGLEFSFLNLQGTFSDETQKRIEQKLRKLTGGDMMKPIVAMGWNSVSFDGYNLALRLRHAGYTNVYWYRGGREGWEVAGMPEDVVRPSD